MTVNSLRIGSLALVLAIGGAFGASAQTPSPATTPAANAAPHQSGTIKAVTPHDFVLTTSGGQDIAVTVPASARIVIVPPGSTSLSAGTPGTMADLAAGDRTIVNGTAGDVGPMLNATRVIVIKSGAIAARNAADQAAWARGGGGIVRSVDAGAGIITVANGARTLTVDTSANTVVRRYSGSSVRFEDAVKSSIGAIGPGDQLRARGERSPDGTTIVADEIVTGSFGNFSGTLTAVDPTAGTVTLKDLATKRTLTVGVTDRSNLRRLPPGAMQAMAARGGGGTAGTSGAASGDPGSTARPGAEHAAPPGGSGRAGVDLSRMVNRLPTETLGGLKPGDAVMIVASNNSQSGEPTAITLLVGVEQILAAHPAGETTLSPWSLGGGGEGESGGGEAGAAH